MRGVRPCTLVAIGIKSGDTPEVRAGIEIAEIEALDLRGSAGNPGLVDELFELGVSGNLEVITSGIRHRGPREVVVREITGENLTVLRSDQLSRRGGKLVRLRGHGALSVHERAEVTVHGDVLFGVTKVDTADFKNADL